MRKALYLGALLVLASLASATTLERLTVDDMVKRSTAIVRGKVLDSSAVQQGNLIYTVYRIQVSEWIKGTPSTSTTTSVYVPGGTLGAYRQSFAGTPALDKGAEYVVFIWVSPRGIPQVIGLSQGVFDVKVNAQGETILSRGALEAEMVDPQGRPVNDSGLKLTLRKLTETVRNSEVK